MRFPTQPTSRLLCFCPVHMLNLNPESRAQRPQQQGQISKEPGKHSAHHFIFLRLSTSPLSLRLAPCSYPNGAVADHERCGRQPSVCATPFVGEKEMHLTCFCLFSTGVSPLSICRPLSEKRLVLAGGGYARRVSPQVLPRVVRRALAAMRRRHAPGQPAPLRLRRQLGFLY
jgi:hypothetical protein